MQNLSDWSCLLLAPTTAFLLPVLLVPVVRRTATRSGYVSLPTQERRRQQSIHYLGGIAFFLGFLVSTLLWGFSFTRSAPLLVISFFVLILGLYDDFRRINPAMKLVGRVIVAAMAIFWGYSLIFSLALFWTLCSRFCGSLGSRMPSIFLTIWMGSPAESD
jgi:UDP-GlcNAc:undecaprenyl-phosphate GlcNAc-1-phosphate transferase